MRHLARWEYRFGKKMKKSRLNETLIISIGLFIIWLIFFLNEEFVLSNDLILHSEFALKLPDLPEMGIQNFSQKVKYSHILSYPGWHILFLGIFSICERVSEFLDISTGKEALSVVAQAIENAALLVLTFRIIVSVNGRYYGLDKKWSDIFGVIVMFVGPLYIPIVNRRYYIGQFTANPWHNPTTFAIKPLAVGTFFLYCWIWKRHRRFLNTDRLGKKERKKENISLCGFSLCLLIGAYLKPNFYQVFVPALFCFCVIDVIRSRFRSLFFCIKTGFSVMPVCAMALAQYLTSFTASDNKVVFRPFEVWGSFTGNMAGSLLVSIAFPVEAYLLCSVPEKKSEDPALLLSILVFVSGISQFILFSFEEGGGAGDFVWGVYLAVLFLFIVGCNRVFKYIRVKKRLDWKGMIAVLLLSLHFLCGVGYFLGCFLCNSFNI